MKCILPQLLLCLLSSLAFGQSPVLLKDFQTRGASSFPNDPYFEGVSMDNLLFFLAETPGLGEELYRTNGTEVGTVLLKDILPGESGSNIRFFGAIDGQVLFAAHDGVHGYELWTSQGTSSSTRMVDDLFEGSTGGFSGLGRGHAFFQGEFYFKGNEGNGNELFKYNADDQEITLFRDINPNTSSSGLPLSGDPRLLSPGEEVMYFTANDGVNGRELWSTDGTPQGTQMVVDISEGELSTQFHQMKTFNNTVIFTANDRVHGRELWFSLGSPLFTGMIKDFSPGEESSDIQIWEVVNEILFFTIKEGFKEILWSTDGSEQNTQKVLDSAGSEIWVTSSYTLYKDQLFFRGNGRLLKTDSTGTTAVQIGSVSPQRDQLAVSKDTLFFIGSLGSEGNGLFKTDGSTEGTSLVKVVTPKSYYDANNLFGTETHLYFIAETDSFGLELFSSDGTEEGTFMLIDSQPGPEDGYKSYEDYTFHALGDKLLFPGFDEVNGREPWISDGTVEGTGLISDLNDQTEGISLYSRPVALGNRTFFTTDEGLWETDGTSEGTQLVLGGEPVFGLNALGDKLLFTRSGPGNLRTIWISDGDPGNTRPILDSATASSLIFSFQENLPIVGEYMFFSARDPENGYELWKTDGTAVGTQLVNDIHPTDNSLYSFSQGRYLVWGNELFFIANDGVNGNELWKTDGSEEGTLPVADINPFGSSSPNKLTLINDQLFFTANDGTSGTELWKTDGTTGGTSLVKDIFPGGPEDGGLRSTSLIAFGGKLYFSGEDGENGRELWTSDGTEAGTFLFKDFIPGGGLSGSGSPSAFFATDSLLYFSAKDSVGRRVWKTDGTVEGTQLLLDLEINSGFTLANGNLFFAATEDATGRELWRTNGTEAGTFLAADIFQGQANSNPRDLRFINEVLYFQATDVENGRELRALSPYRIQAEFLTSLELPCTIEDSITFSATGSGWRKPRWLVNDQAVDGQTSQEFTA